MILNKTSLKKAKNNFLWESPTILNFPKESIDVTIESMEKHMKLIVKTKGNRTKYWIFIIYARISLILFVKGKVKNKTKQD